jgi:hypothetical protein
MVEGSMIKFAIYAGVFFSGMVFPHAAYWLFATVHDSILIPVFYEPYWKRVWWVVHNAVAHPLLVVWPKAGEWLHGWTERRM